MRQPAAKPMWRNSVQHPHRSGCWTRHSGAVACSGNTALEQRITAWQRCHISVSRDGQEAELKTIRAEFSEYAAIHSHILQDVLARLDKTYQACFGRLSRGEKAGFPRYKGR